MLDLLEMGLGAALGALLVMSFSLAGSADVWRHRLFRCQVPRKPLSRLWALLRVGVGFGGLRWGGGSLIAPGSHDTRWCAPVPSGLRVVPLGEVTHQCVGLRGCRLKLC